MLKLIMMKGLPGSGKSTIARKLVDDSGFVRVNKDDLRAMLHNSKWSKGNEKQILKARDWLVRASLSAGKSVVVDDTNFAPEHERELRTIAQDHKAAFEVNFVNTPLDECIKRDLNRLNSVGETVIRRMYNKYLRVIENPKASDGAPAVLCDIDGTLAHMNGRSPFDWKRVGEDELDKVVAANLMAYELLRDTFSGNMKIILVSGRDEVCRSETEAWLEENGVPYDLLYMRPEGDSRKDSIVKAEIYEEHINGKYNVNFVFDDRDQVVEMWRNKGLKVLQVAEGDF